MFTSNFTKVTNFETRSWRVFVPAMETFLPTFAMAFTALFSLQVVYGQGEQLEITKFEDYRAVKLQIRGNQTVTEVQNDDYYVIEVRTRLNDGRVEYEGRVVLWNNTCTVTYQKSVRCVTKSGPVEFYKKINHSHVEMELKWTWKDNNSGKLKTFKWRKKLNGKYHFDSDMTLIIATLAAVALSMGCFLLFPAASLPAYAFLERQIRKKNTQPQRDLFQENHEENIVLKALTRTYSRVRQRWSNMFVSIHSEGDSEETRKETMEPEVKEIPQMSSNNEEKGLDETRAKPEKGGCTKTATKPLYPAIQKNEPGDPAVEVSERVSFITDQSETSRSKRMSIDSEADLKENCNEALTSNKAEESYSVIWLRTPSIKYDEELVDADCSKHAAKGEETPHDIILHTDVPDTSVQYSTEKSEQELQFLLVGKTGVGKRSTGNTILGKNLFDMSAGYSSKTRECQTHHRDVEKWRVEITDSPDLFDTSLTEDNIAVNIVQTVACLHPGPHAFLFVIRIDRYTLEEETTYRRFKAIFDEDVTKHTVIVFTGGDYLSAWEVDIVDVLKTSPRGLKDFVKACGERYVVFDNNATDKNQQVTLLLKIVEKMVKENSSPRYVCPKYMPLSTHIESELQRRLLFVQQREDKYKHDIIELRNLNKLLVKKAHTTETEFKNREKELMQVLNERTKKQKTNIQWRTK